MTAMRKRLVFFLSLFILAWILPIYGSEIKQPIDFSHKTHVKENGVSCEFCHVGARRSSSAVVPPLRTCMGCHSTIDGRSKFTDEEISQFKPQVQKQFKHKIDEIRKIREYWNSKTPIPWKKIHDLPDFVRFSHKRHIQAGFDCTECHGDVSKVKTPSPQTRRGEIPQSMGWCVTCHIENHGLASNGKPAKPLRKTRGGRIIGNAPKTVVHINGSRDCLVCHK